MMRKTVIKIAALSMLAVPGSAFAQTANSAATPSIASAPAAADTPLPPVDPARLAAARPVIDQVWPLGTYARVMKSTMDSIMKSGLASLYQMKPSDIDLDATKAGKDDKTIGALADTEDPEFKSDMDAGMRVMFDEMTKVMTELEPQVRDALAHTYARRFTVAQLDDLHRFFTTPTGAIYAHDSMTMMASPDMVRALQSFMPKFAQRWPDIMKKVEAATGKTPNAPEKGASK